MPAIMGIIENNNKKVYLSLNLKYKEKSTEKKGEHD